MYIYTYIYIYICICIIIICLYVACVCIFRCLHIAGAQRDILSSSAVMEPAVRRPSSMSELQTEIQPELLRGVPLDAWIDIILLLGASIGILDGIFIILLYMKC